MTFGYLDTQNIDFAVGQTESRLRNMQNRLGISFAEFYARVDGALTALNSASDPLVADLITPTDQDRVNTGVTGDKVLQRGGEYSITRPQHSAPSGHLLPIYPWEMTLGVTAEALETMTVDRFTGEVATTIQGFARGQRAEVLERLFKDTEFVLDDDGVGASPGFAGSGTGTNAYGGSRPPGVAAPLSLYARVTTGANAAAQVETFRSYLTYFHGPGPLDLVTSSAGITEVTAMAGFVEAGSTLVRPAVGSTEALVDANQYIGVLNGQIRVRHADPQISGNVLAIFKTYGNEDARNPLAWRYSSIWGRNAYVKERDLYPLANAVTRQHFGIGVNNRVGAALIAVAASGTYAANAPTISR
jgi:hypothetical protein